MPSVTRRVGPIRVAGHRPSSPGVRGGPHFGVGIASASSRAADLANASDSSYAGAITAALFLKEFVPAGVPWAHLDLMAWNLKNQPGRPEGGEAMGLRAAFAWLDQQFGGN